MKPQTWHGCGVKLKIAQDGMLTYTYGTSEFGCKFHMLCEVGQAWQGAFETIIEKLGLKIEQRDAPAPVHYADFMAGA